jgi:hypothetical protein
MSDDEQITVTIPITRAAQRHIEDLQATLTKRNTQIERLTEQLREAETGEPNQTALALAYRRGWKEAAEHLMSATQTAARALGAVRKDAFQIYLQSDQKAE